MNQQNNDILLDAAVKIGKRLCKQAIWQDDKCTWQIITPDMSAPKLMVGLKGITAGDLYQGTAGIALFLLELYKITLDPQMKKVSRGAINNSLSEIPKHPLNSIGFHSGRIGIIYSILSYANYYGDTELINQAKILLEELFRKGEKDSYMDIISGAAGVIPALIHIYEENKFDVALDLAFNLAEDLIDRAHLEPCGWSWETMKRTTIRNLCGFAHGSSGIGHSFIELYKITLNDYYLYCAEQAFSYDRQFFNDKINNWPDFRYFELIDYTFYNRIDELKKALIDNKLLSSKVSYMSAWCHGAPGIGLSRLNAFEFLKNDVYKQESVNACKGTINSLNQADNNYSLCHGIGGNCETLIIGSKILDDENYYNIALTKALEGIEQYENKDLSWPCGTSGGQQDPSLLLGEAGIGYFLLRLYDDNIPSVLCVAGRNENKIKHEKPVEIITLQQKYAGEYFKYTLKLINKLTNTKVNIFEQSEFSIRSEENKIDIISNKIKLLIESQPIENKEKLEDIFEIESQRLENIKNIRDYTEEYLKGFTKLSFETINWETAYFKLNHNCKLLEQKYDWIKFIQGGINLDISDADDNYYLLYQLNNDIKFSKISPTIYLILKSCENNSDLKVIESNLAENYFIDEGIESKTKLRNVIKGQLYEAYTVGVLELLS
jgi:hypothetical protein